MAKGIQPFLDQYEALLDDREALDRAFDEQTAILEKLESEQARVTAVLAIAQRRHELLAAMLGMRDSDDEARARAAEAPMVEAIERELRKSGSAGVRLQLIDIMRDRRQGPWTPAELIECLRERAVETSRSNLQTTLRNMVADGQVVKLRRGAYRLDENLFKEVSG